MDIAILALSALFLALGAGAMLYAMARLSARLNAPPADSELVAKLREMTVAQSELAGRLAQLTESQTKGQTDLQKTLTESLKNQGEQTAKTLGGLTERLTVIDQAQKNITALSGEMKSLQEILSDKQTRGAFGQERMESIVADQLAPDQYEFQATLSNGSRPDCAIRIPNVTARIVVDSKFPLESFELLRVAANEDERKNAMARLRADMQKHIKDIIDKYLIPGETQTPAILFVPSESIYAELHANFSELLRRARAAQVVVVSPHVFMLVIGTIQGLMRDAKMREQAHEIQRAVGGLLQDAKRLGDRIGDLRKHFDTTNKDIGQIEISLKAIDRNAERIAQVELAPPEAGSSPALANERLKTPAVP